MKKQIKIADRFIGELNSCFVIAEAGSNHNGNLDLGKKLIDSAKECGCDAVKFQAFKTENLVTKKALKAEYQKGKSSGRGQFEMLKELELSRGEHRVLIKHAKTVGIPIFYSVFDQESADLIEELGIDIFKLGSGELTNLPLISYLAKKGKPLIISCGMSTDGEVADAVRAFKKGGNDQLLLMNCAIGYPSRLEDANLRRIKYLERKFGFFCGNSDHTLGILVSAAAAALGTLFIEKHFSLDKNLTGPDHPMSMDPTEMKRLLFIIRILEKKAVAEDSLREALGEVGIEATQKQIEVILGCGDRKLSRIEISQRIWARKSIVAARDINRDKILTNRDIAIKRPEEGILPKDYKRVLGRRIKFSIEQGTPIKWDMLV